MSEFTTRDGCIIRYSDTDPDSSKQDVLVLLSGWSQSAAMYGAFVERVSERYRVISYDHRNHGESGSSENGARIATLASDLHELLTTLGLEKVNLTGNSMGCSVIWSYLDLYGPDRVSSLVLIDQPTVCALVPWLEDKDAAEVGAILDFNGAAALVKSVLDDNSDQVRKDFVRSMMLQDMDESTVEWIYEQNLKLRMPFGARLLLDHVMQDWRDLLPRITVPTLVVGGEASHVDTTSQKWNASQIPGAELHIFTREEGGDHFPFLQAPDRFTEVVEKFFSSV